MAGAIFRDKILNIATLGIGGGRIFLVQGFNDLQVQIQRTLWKNRGSVYGRRSHYPVRYVWVLSW